MTLQTTDQAIAAMPLFAAAAACTAKAVRVAGFDTEAARAAILEALTRSGSAMTGEELVDHCQRVAWCRTTRERSGRCSRSWRTTSRLWRSGSRRGGKGMARRGRGCGGWRREW